MTRSPANPPDTPAVTTTCSACGAALRNGETCADYFAQLLALDHSREEPWGSRHGLAVAAYSLQHAHSVTATVLTQCWALLNRVYVHGNDRADVVKGMRGTYRNKHDKGYSKANMKLSEVWDTRALPNRNPPHTFAVTISQLGTFPADTYADQLDSWCLATLAAWSSAER